MIVNLPIRIAAGAIIFAVLALLDWRKNRRRATRWKEYLFLLTTVAAALLYGIINDELTSRISWEYFYYGKGLDEILPPQPIPHPRLSWEAAKIGMQATWTAGLVIGVALLIANNPSKHLPRLSYGTLRKILALVFVYASLFAVVFGLAGYGGFFIHFSTDFTQMVRHDEFRPYRFMAVFGIHLGGYIGAVIGTILAVIIIRRSRSHLLV